MPSSKITMEPLRTILRMELANGCNNTTVIGGLDKYLSNWFRENSHCMKPPEVIKSFNLGESGYASLDSARRKEWILAVSDWLDRYEKSAVQKPPGQKSRSSGAEKPTEYGVDSPVTIIKGVKTGIAPKLHNLGIDTVRDLLYFFPRRYIDYSNRKSIAELRADMIPGEEGTILATIWESNVVKLGKKKGTDITVGDKTGIARAVWFNQPFLARVFHTNDTILMTGKVTVYKGQIVFESPEWELVNAEDMVQGNLLIPVYPLTSGIYPRQMRNLVKRAINDWLGGISEFLPDDVRTRNEFPGIGRAIYWMHYPNDQEQLATARRRLAFDELFLIQLGMLRKKRNWQTGRTGHSFGPDMKIIREFLKSLPFSLTNDQKKVLSDILADMKKSHAMSRLLQGDVGSGKTVIAITALLAAAISGYQGALMAPTEILAEQHYINVCKLFSGLCASQQSDGNICHFLDVLGSDISFALLTGRLTEKEKNLVQKHIEQGEVDIAIGTHALIQKGVEFKNLGLAVVDEQHRFGVTQRSALRRKGFNPHILVMTATPIPRTLALTLYGDLDISVIEHLPPGRQTIKTRWFRPELRERAYEFIRNQIKEGYQAFIICPLIEESDNIEARAAVAEFKRLSKDIFPEFTLGLLHGKMSSDEKDDIMSQFRNGEMDILVSTPVVEVGIDVPNATVMLIEGAERFGLAQLHQFRGRVGRGEAQSYCLLLSDVSDEGSERLKWMEEINDGFVLAEKDLELRGPGEFFGTRQSGLPDLRVAKLSDVQLITLAREEAIALHDRDSNLKEEQKIALVRELSRVWPTSGEWS